MHTGHASQTLPPYSRYTHFSYKLRNTQKIVRCYSDRVRHRMYMGSSANCYMTGESCNNVRFRRMSDRNCLSWSGAFNKGKTKVNQYMTGRTRLLVEKVMPSNELLHCFIYSRRMWLLVNMKKTLHFSCRYTQRTQMPIAAHRYVTKDE